MVTRIDRGHYRIRLDEPGLTEDSSGNITAMKARELGRGKVVVGDRVAVVGDTSGRKGTLARMVRIEERTTLLRRSAEDGDTAGTERGIVANANQLVIVTAVADPEPRPRMIDRYLVAAYDAGMEPLIVLTKTDLADAAPLTDLYGPLGVRCLATRLSPHIAGTEPSQTGGDQRPDDGIEAVRQALNGASSVLVGHSGVGKSTLINALVPGADRATGHVNEVTGRGRHTSTSLQALELPGGGWVIDTPGVRSFGVSPRRQRRRPAGLPGPGQRGRGLSARVHPRGRRRRLRPGCLDWRSGRAERTGSLNLTWGAAREGGILPTAAGPLTGGRGPHSPLKHSRRRAQSPSGHVTVSSTAGPITLRAVFPGTGR